MAPSAGPYGTTATLFDPTGSDANPIGGNWTTDITGTGHSDWKRVSNTLAPDGAAGNAQAYYASGTYGIGGTGHEVWFAIPTIGSNGQYVDLWTMISSPGSSGNGYGIEIGWAAGTDTWDLYRDKAGSVAFPITGGSGTASSTQEVAAGDYAAISITPDGSGYPYLEAWYWNGSAWTAVCQYTDSSANRVTTDGYFGLEATNNGAVRIGTIYGGVIPAAGSSANNLALLGVGS